jgi:hypothetical protein
MFRSRLRLQLAGWFALAILLGLAVLDLGLFTALRRVADRQLTVEVLTAARGCAWRSGGKRQINSTSPSTKRRRKRFRVAPGHEAWSSLRPTVA